MVSKLSTLSRGFSLSYVCQNISLSSKRRRKAAYPADLPERTYIPLGRRNTIPGEGDIPRRVERDGVDVPAAKLITQLYFILALCRAEPARAPERAFEYLDADNPVTII